MKRTIKVGHGAVRLWRDEVPSALYRAVGALEREVESLGQDTVLPPTSIAVEVWLPTGARALYGLLGGSLHDYDRRTCSIVVSVGTFDDALFTDSVAPSYEEVRVGLPAEYAREAIHWLASEVEAAGLRSSRLIVDRAAHSLVGSSRAVFAALSVLNVQLLVERFDEESDDVVASTVRKVFDRAVSRRLGPGSE